MGDPIIESKYSREGINYNRDTKTQRRFGYIKALRMQQMKQDPDTQFK